MKYIVTFLFIACGAYFVLDELFTSHSMLFYTDMAVVVAELLLLSNIPLLSGDNSFNIKNAISGVVLNTTAIMLVTWMLVFNLAFRHTWPIEYYWIGLILILCYFLFKGVILSSAADASMTHQAQLDKSIANSKLAKAAITDYTSEIAMFIARNASIDKRDELQRLLRTTNDKISSLPIGIVERNTGKLEDIANVYANLCSVCSQDDWNTQLQQEIKDTLQGITKQINNFK